MWCSGYKPRYHSAAFRSSRRRLVVLWSLFGFFIISLESSGSSCCPPKNFLTWVMFRLYSTPSASRVKLFPCWPSQLTVLIKILKSFCHGFVIVSQDLYLQVQYRIRYLIVSCRCISEPLPRTPISSMWKSNTCGILVWIYRPNISFAGLIRETEWGADRCIIRYGCHASFQVFFLLCKCFFFLFIRNLFCLSTFLLAYGHKRVIGLCWISFLSINFDRRKSAKVIANRAFFCVNIIYHPFINPELINTTYQRKWGNLFI